MPRKEPFPYSHHVKKTRKDHKCEACGGVIPTGSRADYKNLFTGKRGYRHYLMRDCAPFLEEHRLRMKKINEQNLV